MFSSRGAGISMVASNVTPGRAQVSVCAASSRPRLDSYAATSSTGSSAVASLSTSDEGALLFTGGIEGVPDFLAIVRLPGF